MKDVYILPMQTGNKKRISERSKSYNRKTLLWLVLFFPVGFKRMVSASCSWKKGVKYGVSCFACLLVAAVMFIPSPQLKSAGGIYLYGDDSAGEPYGPTLPATIVGGYTAPVIQSVVLPAEEEENTTTYVYATTKQENYHTGTCQFAYASGQKLTVYEAHFLGYTPGRCCDAPAYTGVVGQ